jgi:hypothetical protein
MTDAVYPIPRPPAAHEHLLAITFDDSRPPLLAYCTSPPGFRPGDTVRLPGGGRVRVPTGGASEHLVATATDGTHHLARMVVASAIDPNTPPEPAGSSVPGRGRVLGH